MPYCHKTSGFKIKSKVGMWKYLNDKLDLVKKGAYIMSASSSGSHTVSQACAISKSFVNFLERKEIRE